ncbi:MAG: murein transglycosylase A [Proteobacteria bacterium]|nr:murein transglycosylase A [Pseudomonadota bacterium]MBU1737580.1 murein transglycosylase A [Pseudomonadota bacterium]
MISTGKKNICLLLCLVILRAFTAVAGEDCYGEVVSVADVPGFFDDLAGAGIDEALATSLEYYGSQPPERRYVICNRSYRASEMVETLVEFRAVYQRVGNRTELQGALQEKFELCPAAGGAGRDGRMLVTGYFEPVVAGSLVKKPPFVYPVYSAPPDLVVRGDETGRIENGRLVPYWSRAEIEERGVLAGQELVYLADRVEAFILHVQGSGKVRLRDGRTLDLQFAAKNGRPYRSIGKLLVDRGAMDLEQVSLPAIISYLEAHPREVDEILKYNESYVFFRWGGGGRKGPLGSLGRVLTPGRSVAVDNDCFAPGAPAYLETRKPLFAKDNLIIGWAPLKRFVFSHDTGSAIKGSGRLDLFLGGGTQARAAAGNLKSPGRLYFLVKKK